MITVSQKSAFYFSGYMAAMQCMCAFKRRTEYLTQYNGKQGNGKLIFHVLHCCVIFLDKNAVGTIK